MEAEGSWLAFVLGVIAASSLIAADTELPTDHQQVCQWDSFEARCPVNEVILMTSARYGRMRLGSCVVEDLGHLGCSKDVLSILDSECSGRFSCSVSVPNPKLDQARPCPELQSYLEASYRCLKVDNVADSACFHCDYIVATASSGYIANAVSQDSNCGTTECPWLIEVQKGQSISIKLLDFSAGDQGSAISSATHGSAQGSVCRVLAVIKGQNQQERVTVCTEGIKEREVFKGLDHSVEIRIMAKAKSPGGGHYFLLQYEVTGCGDPVVPEGAWLSRDSDVARVGCSSGSEEWKLDCISNRWIGSLGNCSNEYKASKKINRMFLAQETSLGVIAGVSVVICLVVVTIGLACHRVNLNRQPPRRSVNSTEMGLYQRTVDPTEVLHLARTADGKEIMHCVMKGPQQQQLQQQQQHQQPPMMCNDGCNDYTHIWETPLPQPKMVHMGLPTS